MQGAVIALDNQTGGILVLVGGRDFEHNQYDRALQAKRPAGTAMKPFVYAAAFENGLFPGSLVEDSALDNRAVMIGGTTGILGEWGPETADNRYEGPMTARQALAKSKNGATVRIGMTVGVEPVIQLCHAAGIRSQLRPYPRDISRQQRNHAGGARARLHDFSQWRLAAERAAYSRSDRRKGRHSRLASRGRPARSRKSSNRRSPTKCIPAWSMRSNRARARPRDEKFGLKKFPAAGKTGTAYDFTDALFAGYDNAITCAVWAGFDKPQKIYRGAFGSEIALPVWVDVMNASIERLSAAGNSAARRECKRSRFARESGLLATDKCYDDVKSASWRHGQAAHHLYRTRDRRANADR